MRSGVPVRPFTLARAAGSRPSRAMTKKIRLWPYMKARITVGRATTAAAAMIRAAPGACTLRRIRANGSALLAKRPKGMAPRAAAAITM